VHRPNEFPFESMMDPTGSLFELWISFFPTAPLFGVPWRFAPNGVGAACNPWTAWIPKAPERAKRKVRIDTPQRPAAAHPTPVEEAEIVEAAPAAVNDDLKRIKGIGPKLEAELKAMGVTSLAQIAAFTAEDLASVDAALTSIKGRCYRDDWVGQAKALTA